MHHSSERFALALQNATKNLLAEAKVEIKLANVRRGCSSNVSALHSDLSEPGYRGAAG